MIEHEQPTLSLLLRGLKREGYLVEGAGDVRTGLADVLDQQWDLLVLDAHQPQLIDVGLLRELHRRCPRLPVLIISTPVDASIRLRFFEFGAVDFVSRPFALEELVARVRVQLRRLLDDDRDDGIVRGARVTLDVARRQAQVDGRVCLLANREFQLLHYFLLHEGEVLSRQRLLADVWGYDFDPGTNVVEAGIRRLRARLGSRTLVETVRNAGYRLTG